MWGLFVGTVVVGAMLFALGVRLVRIGPGPERLLGGSLGLAGLMLPPRVIGVRLIAEGNDADWVFAMSSLGEVGIGTGICLIAFFVQRTFHPESRWAVALAWALTAATLGSLAAALAVPGELREASAAAIAANGLRASTFVWAFVECLRYRALMRRRVEVGLADPVVADRFRLWAIWTGVFGLGPGIVLVLRLWMRSQRAAGIEAEASNPVVFAVITVLVLVVVPTALGALLLSFFPPRWYRRRLARRAGQGGATA